jgi:hypothetical protein
VRTPSVQIDETCIRPNPKDAVLRRKTTPWFAQPGPDLRAAIDGRRRAATGREKKLHGRRLFTGNPRLSNQAGGKVRT